MLQSLSYCTRQKEYLRIAYKIKGDVCRCVVENRCFLEYDDFRIVELFLTHILLAV